MRIANRVIAAVLGLVVAVGGLLLAVEVAIAFVGGGPWVVPYDEWYRNARTTAWSTGDARGILIGMVVVGLVLLVLQLVRRSPATLSLRPGAAGSYAVDRRSLQRSLARAARRVDGIDSAQAKVAERSVRIRVDSRRRVPDGLENAVTTAVRARIAALDLATEPNVGVRLRNRKASP